MRSYDNAHDGVRGRGFRLAGKAKAADVKLTRKEWYEVYLSTGNRHP